MNWELVIDVLKKHELAFQHDIETARNTEQALAFGAAALVIGAFAEALKAGLQK